VRSWPSHRHLALGNDSPKFHFSRAFILFFAFEVPGVSGNSLPSIHEHYLR